MGKLARQLNSEEEEYELPISMVDVVFLLLIFFMVASKFKQPEYRLDADLPKDEGQNPMPADIDPPQEVRVYLRVPKNNRDGVLIGLDHRDPPFLTPDQLVPHLMRLMATPSGSNTAIVIFPTKEVKFKHVIHALDACSRANVETVKFQAPTDPEGGGHDWWHE